MNVLSNNSRIAKNTMALYIRMLLMMAVGFYTSRVILQILGEDDYGIQNVVGGLVAMFAFVNGAMSTSTSRHLTYELGVGSEDKIRQVFSASLYIHVVVALLLFVLCETIGLYFLYAKMQVPADRFEAALWVYHFAALTAVLNILSVPYNAAIIAHEKMTAFAYIAILDVIVKLAIVLVLPYIAFDNLKVYAVLLFLGQVVIQFVYMMYSKSKFDEVCFIPRYNKDLFKELISFAGWNLWGNMAVVLYNHGLNLLLNVFFGPVVNAARGVAYNAQLLICKFIANFQTALNPQITKSYVANDFEYMRKLVYVSSKYSFFIMLLIAVPLLVETPYFLELWLKNYPEYSVSFLRVMIFVSLVDALSNPLMVSAQATGDIKKYQMVVGGILLAILPLSYVALKMGLSPISVFVVQFACTVVSLFARLYMLRGMIKFSTSMYVKGVLVPVFFVSVLSIAFGVGTKCFISSDTFGGFVAVCLISVMFTLAVIGLIGVSRSEREIIVSKISSFKRKI